MKTKPPDRPRPPPVPMPTSIADILAVRLESPPDIEPRTARSLLESIAPDLFGRSLSALRGEDLELVPGFMHPIRVVDLKDVPPAAWGLADGTVYLWKRRQWERDPDGCVLCDEDETAGGTLTTVDGGRARSVCTEHGELEAVAYHAKRTFTIRCGSMVRESEDVQELSFLFPSSVSAEERADEINRILDEDEARSQDGCDDNADH